ncbi:NAD(P)-binding protein [Ophiobolus disseminans]|uniref:NAD(P)-binding protein n=1 Tax=Ophiobolus disseminans TaxID=1469910 RepID=A0A6A7AJD0_9PLEO|nr:NAD(P)-binding protein [Ophiobolus disseminans]
MPHSILITGASGYLGGSLLAELDRITLPPHEKLYGLVRSQEQADAVKQYGAEPLILDLKNERAVLRTIVDAKISIVYFLIDALNSELQIPLIKALGEVKRQTGQDVHFLHTSGAKIFSNHAGMPSDQELRDTDPALFELQKTAKAPYPTINRAVSTNNIVIETAEASGVRSYIFVPCIVYGEGKGFGNRISIQTTAVVKAAKATKTVYDVNAGAATWPVCHVRDNTALYVKLLESILSGHNQGYGKEGYYLASSGSVAWNDIYASMATALAERGVVASSKVKKADDAAIARIGQALACPKELVTVQIGGTCTFTPQRASELGWKAEYPPEHILEVADAEVDMILKYLKD